MYYQDHDNYIELIIKDYIKNPLDKEYEYSKSQLAPCFDLVLDFFEGDIKKAWTWFGTPNPMFGGASPLEMVYTANGKKLLKTINQVLAENKSKDSA